MNRPIPALFHLQFPKLRLDPATIIGLIISIGSILVGMTLEGGRIGDLVQLTAAMIVLGGTAGAVLVNTSPEIFWRALKRTKRIFRAGPPPARALVDRMIACSHKARKSGILSLESEADSQTEHFLYKALLLAVDGASPAVIREHMELEINLEEAALDEEARVFEAGGGYAPTVGIIGAVLGLIQVMKHLDNIGEVGHGIAVAFVSTVYGVGLANLILLPAAGKMRALAEQHIRMRELVLEGVIGIAEGRNPKLIRDKLNAFLPGAGSTPKAKPERAFIVKQAARG